MNLAELFPEGDYRFHLTLRRGEPRDFLQPRDATGALLAERSRWVAEAPTRYTAAMPEAEAILTEFSELARTWGMPPASARIQDIATRFEPDLLFLGADPDGNFRLKAGALCFPTGWALEEKLGQTLDDIHGVVPGLNAALAAPIRNFLGKLRPGAAFLRHNWGLTATDELNLHPARNIAPPASSVALDRLWLRVEHQALFALPRTHGIVFGIRIALHRLDELVQAGGGPALKRALLTMPAELARYKRIDAVRDETIAQL